MLYSLRCIVHIIQFALHTYLSWYMLYILHSDAFYFVISLYSLPVFWVLVNVTLNERRLMRTHEMFLNYLPDLFIGLV